MVVEADHQALMAAMEVAAEGLRRRAWVVEVALAAEEHLFEVALWQAASAVEVVVSYSDLAGEQLEEAEDAEGHCSEVVARGGKNSAAMEADWTPEPQESWVVEEAVPGALEGQHEYSSEQATRLVLAVEVVRDLWLASVVEQASSRP